MQNARFWILFITWTQIQMNIALNANVQLKIVEKFALDANKKFGFYTPLVHLHSPFTFTYPLSPTIPSILSCLPACLPFCVPLPSSLCFTILHLLVLFSSFFPILFLYFNICPLFFCNQPILHLPQFLIESPNRLHRLVLLYINLQITSIAYLLP